MMVLMAVMGMAAEAHPSAGEQLFNGRRGYVHRAMQTEERMVLAVDVAPDHRRVRRQIGEATPIPVEQLRDQSALPTVAQTDPRRLVAEVKTTLQQVGPYACASDLPPPALEALKALRTETSEVFIVVPGRGRRVDAWLLAEREVLRVICRQ